MIAAASATATAATRKNDSKHFIRAPRFLLAAGIQRAPAVGRNADSRLYMRRKWSFEAAHIVSQYALTVGDDSLGKRVWILEILSGEAVRLYI
jgi:hypothetical protein